MPSAAKSPVDLMFRAFSDPIRALAALTSEGAKLARESLDSGAALKALDALIAVSNG